MWIKICGMTTPEAVAAAIEARVDAIGFVFAASPRQVSAERAHELAAPARGRVHCVAVSRHPTQSAVNEILAVFKPDVLQSDVRDLQDLRLPASLGLLPVVRAGEPAPATLPARILFEGPMSGAGIAADWQAARELARRTQVVLAGGLRSANVAAAIAAARPFGVDVSSGVEERPGIKSPLAIVQFVAAVRAAPAA
ncbi:MAG: N-(5'-phosphoribosyl)anthranilate isomerase [Steroidobacterales bacterium]|jgi:phosphoribosylanthranilate isomerase